MTGSPTAAQVFLRRRDHAAALAEALLTQTAEVWNLYGPTETTIYSTRVRLQSGSRSRSAAPSRTPRVCARPNGQPVLSACPGAVHWRAGLARGYLNQPELTAERFIPIPSAVRLARASTGPGTAPVTWRMGPSSSSAARSPGENPRLPRRTGRDRGSLGEHPQVQSAVVVARQAPSGDRCLAAYVVPHPGRSRPAANSVASSGRSCLSTCCPRLPDAGGAARTPSGKVDRQALSR